ncbi:hypothetical protein [Atlantibacter hermannii]|uniref:hypothetical protein n=1 Tax=Atlantibacter hermannii TaxID=565 RepID=UPI0028AF7855|nr:hypothetical protein [Atlantibacter hermannii]
MKKKTLSIIFFIGIFTSFLLVMFVPDTAAEKAGLIDLCSKITKESMKSPSSYKMNNASVEVMIGIPSVGARTLNDGPFKDAVLSGRIPYRMANVIIQQEAKNSFGVSLVGETFCRYSILGEAGDASYRITSVNIDGKNLSDIDITIRAGAGEYNLQKGMYLKRIKYIEYYLMHVI